MNSVNLSGRLVADAEVIEYGKGKDKHQMARFRIAVRDGLDEDGNPRAQFIQCTLFGDNAVNTFKTFTGKGMAVSVTGKLKNGMYEDKNGVTRYTTDVWVTDFDLIGASKNSEDEETEEKNRPQSGKKYHR